MPLRRSPGMRRFLPPSFDKGRPRRSARRPLERARWVTAVACLVAAALADDQATSLAEARTAVEANLKTREGKTYDEKLGKEFMEKHLGTMKQCAQRAENDLESFWILMKLDKDDALKEVLLHPATKLGACAKETLLKGTFSPPPRGAYWVSVYMKLTH
jgi:hypothetical protein